MRTITRGGERVERRRRLAEQRAAPRIDDERDPLTVAATAFGERRWHQRGREVIEDVVAEILEDLHRL